LEEEISIASGTPNIKKHKPGVKARVSRFIDDKYIEDDFVKIEIHKKINEIDSKPKLVKVKHELEDRFGKIDKEMEIYMYEEWFEKLANELNIKRVKQTKTFIEVQLDRNLTESLDGNLLFEKVTYLSRSLRFSSKMNILSIMLDTVKLDKHFIYYLVDLMLIIKECKKVE
jgi:transcription-repair coupling factor (superfamily II helicase)